MLDVNIEFSRGVLFVRLSGSITKDNINNIKYNIKSILEKSGIKFLVFNLSELNMLDDISLFDECNSVINKNKGKMIICGNDSLNYLSAKNELSALRMLTC